MQFIQFEGHFDKNGQATVSLNVPEFGSDDAFEAFIAIESIGLKNLEAIGIETRFFEGVGEEQGNSRIPTLFRSAFGQVRDSARSIGIAASGVAGRAFRGIIAFVRRKSEEIWNEFRDDPTCYGCVKVAIWLFKAALAAIGIPTIGDEISSLTTNALNLLIQTLTSSPFEGFFLNWFGPRGVEWITKSTLGQWLNSIFRVTLILDTIARSMCHDIGVCELE